MPRSPRATLEHYAAERATLVRCRWCEKPATQQTETDGSEEPVRVLDVCDQCAADMKAGE